MNKTKTHTIKSAQSAATQSLKVVCNPFAPEDCWLPACDQMQSTALASTADSSQASPVKKLIVILAVSGLAAWWGGAFCGQSVHTLYYFDHQISQIFFGDTSFEPWGEFYFWFHQITASFAFMPIFFSFAFGFLTSSTSGIRFCTALWAGIVALYFFCIHSNYPLPWDFVGYYWHWFILGISGSCVGYALGKRIAGELSKTLKQEKVFYAMLIGLCPAILFSFSYPILQNFSSAFCLCVLIPYLVGIMPGVVTRARSTKTSICLALSAASPLFFCSILHIPVAIWFLMYAPFAVQATLTHTLSYLIGFPTVVLVAAIAGGYCASRLVRAMPLKDFDFEDEDVVMLSESAAA